MPPTPQTPIAFATCMKSPEFEADDRLAVGALERRGLSVVAVPWEERADWSRFRAVVLRSTWSYWLAFPEFEAWLRSLQQAGVRVYNSVPTVLTNLRKTYLRDLERRGLAIVPTRFAEPGDFAPMRTARDWSGNPDFILKPSVSGASYRTYRLSAAELAKAENEVREIWESGPALIQPCLPAIFSEGEYSFVYFDGKFSHAVKKRSETGDYRIQHQFGGKYEAVTPSSEEVERAARYFEGLNETPLYARVDLIRHEGKLVLMELELTEPSLFFTEGGEASAERFAEALVRKLQSV